MAFNSLVFTLFFIAVFLLYWAIPARRYKWQNLLLLVASFTFYGYWDARFLGLLSLSILSTYCTALLAVNRRRRFWLTVNIVVNLLILGFFKYYNFFVDSLTGLINFFGYGIGSLSLNIILPVGISFYTFQAIGYSVDVYKGKVAAQRNLLTFALFISYFPQLVAGPIERTAAMMPQLDAPRRWQYPQMVLGFRQALWGLAKKVVIADSIAPLADKAFSLEPSHPMLWAWYTWGILIFSVQIYCDFSGYCDIARGISRCLGIELTQNFRLPYFATNVGEFWRRWNASLMSWLRDYIYYPLGGSRCTLARTCLNVMAVFLVSGFWHGASWNFVIWGIYWGAVCVGYRLVKKYCKYTLPRHGDIIVTLGFVVYSRAMFRCEDWSLLCRVAPATILPIALLVLVLLALMWLLQRSPMLRRALPWVTLCGVAAALCVAPVKIIGMGALLLTLAMFVVEWRTRSHDCPLEVMPRTRATRVLIYWLLILLICLSYSEDIPFIYFKF